MTISNICRQILSYMGDIYYILNQFTRLKNCKILKDKLKFVHVEKDMPSYND